jgi:pro-sigmaK processing inhibitor BofA
MIKVIYKIIKRIIFAILFLYGLNLITSNLDIIIPINIITVTVLSLLDISGLGTIIALYFLL